MYFKARIPHAGPIVLETLQAQYAKIGASVPGSPGHIFNTTTITYMFGWWTWWAKCSLSSRTIRCKRSTSHVNVCQLAWFSMALKTGNKNVNSLRNDHTKHMRHCVKLRNVRWSKRCPSLPYVFVDLQRIKIIQQYKLHWTTIGLYKVTRQGLTCELTVMMMKVRHLSFTSTLEILYPLSLSFFIKYSLCFKIKGYI